jgi:hypothetical protein
MPAIRLVSSGRAAQDAHLGQVLARQRVAVEVDIGALHVEIGGEPDGDHGAPAHQDDRADQQHLADQTACLALERHGRQHDCHCQHDQRHAGDVPSGRDQHLQKLMPRRDQPAQQPQR